MNAFAGPWAPALFVLIFILSSLLTIWRLELMSHRGVGGTVLGTVFMPYFSGLGNLIFVGVVLSRSGPAQEVAINCWTNNLTNLCLLIPIPALIWGLHLAPKSKAKKAQREARINRLSLGLSLVALAFFSLMAWALSQDGWLDRFDGMALIGLFLFWQCFHVFEVLKENAKTDRSWHPLIALDLALILLAAFFTLIAVDGIVADLLARESGFFQANMLGFLTGLLMVLPNAVLAFYYAQTKRADIVYASQAGDAHICIPLCIGLFALLRPMSVPEGFERMLVILATLALVHLISVLLFRGLPRPLAALLVVAYGLSFWLRGA